MKARLVAALKAMVATYDGLRDVLTSPVILAKLAEADAAIAEAERGVFPEWQGAKIDRFVFDHVFGVRPATLRVYLADGRVLQMSLSETFEAAEVRT